MTLTYLGLFALFFYDYTVYLRLVISLHIYFVCFQPGMYVHARASVNSKCVQVEQFSSLVTARALVARE